MRVLNTNSMSWSFRLTVQKLEEEQEKGLFPAARRAVYKSYPGGVYKPGLLLNLEVFSVEILQKEGKV